MLLLALNLPRPSVVLTLLLGRGAPGRLWRAAAELGWVVVLRFDRFARKLLLLAAKGDELEERGSRRPEPGVRTPGPLESTVTAPEARRDAPGSRE